MQVKGLRLSYSGHSLAIKETTDTANNAIDVLLEMF